MNANAAVNIFEQEEDQEMFKAQLQQQKLEEYVRKYVMNNDISKERKDENVMLKEDISRIIGDGRGPFVFNLPSGEFAVVKQSFRNREVLDKEAMAQHLGISKDEIKTAFDISMLTKNGVITPDMITNFTVKKQSRSVSVRVMKKNPLDKKTKKFRKKF